MECIRFSHQLWCDETPVRRFVFGHYTAHFHRLFPLTTWGWDFGLIFDGWLGSISPLGDWASVLECWRSQSLRLVIPDIAVPPGVTHSDSHHLWYEHCRKTSRTTIHDFCHHIRAFKIHRCNSQQAKEKKCTNIPGWRGVRKMTNQQSNECFYSLFAIVCVFLCILLFEWNLGILGYFITAVWVFSTMPTATFSLIVVVYNVVFMKIYFYAMQIHRIEAMTSFRIPRSSSSGSLLTECLLHIIMKSFIWSSIVSRVKLNENLILQRIV